MRQFLSMRWLMVASLGEFQFRLGMSSLLIFCGGLLISSPVMLWEQRILDVSWWSILLVGTVVTWLGMSCFFWILLSGHLPTLEFLGELLDKEAWIGETRVVGDDAILQLRYEAVSPDRSHSYSGNVKLRVSLGVVQRTKRLQLVKGESIGFALRFLDGEGTILWNAER